MNVSIRELKVHLSRYLQLMRSGETVVVTSRNKPIAKLEPITESPEDWKDIPGVRWAKTRPRLTRSRGTAPVIEGETLADWIVQNRR
ncbi:type II toxin-antitoxin system prevent-host-death family antitoxin [Methylocaldum sp.]|uniref:type II toxin-antitoxin system Phd/YefM family antitoxin n=1 Tax=Methylocaldum sp. TaxID=1969727 RepID=UPI002D26D24B|nr:type II toxin-antitoxin system prevent-host-death family antitoxin [Methylocaldum sp.]HYE33993.1 type II toxin-antitoxin system prevent-host-death family antitoxin [Methylocaldum sp.]